jgi:hypothetical protein
LALPSRLFEVGPWMLDFNGSKAAVSSISAYLGSAERTDSFWLLLSEHRKCTKSYTVILHVHGTLHQFFQDV